MRYISENSDLFNSGIIGEAEQSGLAKSKDILTIDTANGGINGGIKNAIISKAGIDIAQLVAILGKSRRTVERAVAQLKKEGVIEYRGSKKTGGYYLVERA